MSDTTRERPDGFWELADGLLNAVPFVLIGVEVVWVDFDEPVFTAGALAIPVVLFARRVSVGTPIFALRRLRHFTPHAVGPTTAARRYLNTANCRSEH